MIRSKNLNLYLAKRAALGLTTALVMFSAAPVLSAQEVAPAAPAAAASPTPTDTPAKNRTFFDKYYWEGGFWMHPILLLSITSFGLTVYHLMLFKRAKFNPPELKGALMGHMQACRVRSAIEVAAASPSLLGRMMANALTKVDATNVEDLGRDKVEDEMASQMITETKIVNKTMGFFPVLISIGPMMGLFGTVVGMVDAFDKLVQDSTAGAAQLAGSISTALLTTMWGLLVAIPSIMIYFVLKTKFTALVNETMSDGNELVTAAIDAVQGEAQYARIPEGLQVA